MPGALDSLVAFVADRGGEAISDQLSLSIQLSLATELIRCGHLSQATAVLEDAAAATTPDLCRAIGAQWLALARAHTGEPALAEVALRRAAELDPIRGRPPLAQHLQRQQRSAEAASVWLQVIASRPGEPGGYLSLARLYVRMNQPERALSTYLQLVEDLPTARTYLTVAPLLQELADGPLQARAVPGLRIALLGNSTLDQLTSYLSVECHRAGLRPTIYQAGFDQVTQEILNPTSGLYAFEPDAVVCAIHASRLFPRVHQDPFELSVDERRAEIDAGLSTLQTLLDALTQRTSALVLVHNMVAPQHPALGTLDWRDELGQTELFGEINRRLADMVRTRYTTVYVVDEDAVQARAGKSRATDPRLWLTAHLAWSDPVHLGLAREYVRYLRPLRGLNRKCIVVDLDNTLWGGVIGEDGLDGILLGTEAPGNAFVAFQRELERLWRRGVLLAVCSKNNPEDALAVFRSHPSMVLKLEQIAAQRINWQPKSANLREIAAELNIGLDSLVFLDDNPVERAAMRSELPDVLVPELPVDPAQYRAALLELNVFDSLALTSEDRQRGRLYAEQAQRRDFEAASEGASIEDYLAGLEMVVDIAPANPTTRPRIAQLTGKTNQFNLTTRRYTEADIEAMQAAGSAVFSMRVADRFGDNGLVGVAIVGPLVDAGAREIDSLLLSCRVMGRGVESVLLAALAEQARSSGASSLRGRYVPTAKNAPARDCYARHGFTLADQLSDGTEVWELDLARQTIPVPVWLASAA